MAGESMRDGISVVVALLFISAMITMILAIAWATLGRARHAATWALAFAVGTAEWALNIATMLAGRPEPVLAVIGAALALAVFALLATGFRQRAGAPARWHWLALTALAALAAVVATMTLWPHIGVRRAIPHLFCALILATAAADVVPKGRAASVAERSTVAMLWLFVLFGIAVAALAFASGADGRGLNGLDRMVVLLGLPAAFTGIGLFTVFLLAADLAEKMRLLAARDPLTGILNRRGFEEEAARVIANAVRHRQPLSLALADLDRFKAVNDAHGHAAGDLVLRRFAEDVGDAIRQGDVFGRIGGEEFVLLLVNTPGDAAVTVIDRLRREVATQTLTTQPPLIVTTSFGVAELRGDDTLAALIARADDALYRSKQAGRDRVSYGEANDAPIVRHPERDPGSRRDVRPARTLVYDAAPRMDPGSSPG